MKKMKFKFREVAPVIGFGYWKDEYDKKKLGIEGVAHNIIIPFVRFQWGYLVIEK